jgi:hypothetical protein
MRASVIGVDANVDKVKSILARNLHAPAAQDNRQTGRLAVETGLDPPGGRAAPKWSDPEAIAVAKEKAQKHLDDRCALQLYRRRGRGRHDFREGIFWR